MSSEVKANKVSPATGTDFTFGDSGDTFTVPSGATLAVTGATVTGLSAGKVLQVVTSSYKTFETTQGAGYASSNWVDLGMNASITPTAANSKIMVSFYVAASCSYQCGTIFFGIKRGSTLINIGNQWTTTNSTPNRVQTGWYPTASSSELADLNIFAVDEPSTTSATTYTLSMICSSSHYIDINICGQSVHYTPAVQYPSGASTITLMEIAG
tara:strand:+ start:42 stop:677 length:636 start_codon:yes stop_codon:yes gene_type:complete